MRLYLYLVTVIGAVIGAVLFSRIPLHLDLHLRTAEKGYIQFFIDTGKGFTESKSTKLELLETVDFHHYKVRVRAYGVKAIRIDPFNKEGKFDVASFSVRYLLWNRTFNGVSELRSISMGGIEDATISAEPIWSARSTSHDPKLIIRDLKSIKRWQALVTACGAIFTASVFALGFIVSRHLRWLATRLVVHERTLWLFVIFLAFFSRIKYWRASPLSNNPEELHLYLVDEFTYFQAAKYILNNGLSSYLLSENSLTLTPVNPLYLAFIYYLSESVEVIRLLNVILSVITVALVYKIGKFLFDKWAAFVSATICAIYAPLIEYSATLMTEPLFLVFFVGAVYFMVKVASFTDEIKKRQAIFAGLFLGLAILTRSILMLYPLALLCIFTLGDVGRLYLSRKQAFSWLVRFRYVIFLPIIAVSIVIVKNYIVFQQPILATGSGSALWLGSRADTEGDDPLVRRLDYGVQGVVGNVSPLSIEGDKKLQLAGKTNIMNAPLDYTWWTIKKVGRLLVGNSFVWFESHDSLATWYQNNKWNSRGAVSIVFQVVISAFIVVYGIMGVILLRQSISVRAILGGVILYLIVFSIPFLVIQRYGLPVRIMLVVLAGGMATAMIRNLTQYRRSALFGLVAVTGIVLQVLFGAAI